MRAFGVEAMQQAGNTMCFSNFSVELQPDRRSISVVVDVIGNNLGQVDKLRALVP